VVILLGRDSIFRKFLVYELITLATMIGIELVFLITENTDLIFFVHLLVLCRIPRMLTGLTLFKSFRDIFSVFWKLIPFCYTLSSILFILFYLFGIVGMHLWGGLITKHINLPPDVAPRDYFMNNFNDLASGMITLFELLIVNNW
jgi:two pore calcium channel protein